MVVANAITTAVLQDRIHRGVTYAELERRMMAAICGRFGLPPQCPPRWRRPITWCWPPSCATSATTRRSTASPGRARSRWTGASSRCVRRSPKTCSWSASKSWPRKWCSPCLENKQMTPFDFSTRFGNTSRRTSTSSSGPARTSVAVVPPGCGGRRLCRQPVAGDVYTGVGLAGKDYGPHNRCPSDEITAIAGSAATSICSRRRTRTRRCRRPSSRRCRSIPPK
jgi:hypothetical protein